VITRPPIQVKPVEEADCWRRPAIMFHPSRRSNANEEVQPREAELFQQIASAPDANWSRRKKSLSLL